MKAYQLKPGMVYDGRLIIATDPNKPFFSVVFHRRCGGGRWTFQWNDDVFVDFAVTANNDDAVDAEEVKQIGRGSW